MKRQSGNALWLILLAIFLLGGLTVLLSRTGSNTEETGNTEKTSLKISELFRYASGMKAAVAQLMARGCSENQISFWKDLNGDGVENGSDLDYNPTSPPDRSCHIFYPQGAGITPVAPGKFNGYEFRVGSTSAIGGIGTTGQCGNTSCSDLYLVLYMTANADNHKFCDDINRALGHTNLIPSPGPTTHMAGGFFTGTFGPYHNANNALFVGKAAGCFQHTSGSYDIFWYVLLAR